MARNDIPETIVATGMVISGELKSNGNIRIHGTVSGKVQTSQDLVLGSGAQIDADLLAHNALIAGTVKGNVTVKGSLTLTDTGKILGNIVCAKLAIQDGGVFNGNCIMRQPKEETKFVEEPKKTEFKPIV